MIPNMYKIAGELTPFVMHVAARTVATHALSIFGDHSDVMACRPTGFAMLASNSPQEAHDLAAVAHAATLRGRVPFLHFFDGFRTSHELQKVRHLSDDDLSALFGLGLVREHLKRGLTPDHPVLRGTAQNPDVFFQAREAGSPFYAALPDHVQAAMDALFARTGRRYRLFDYAGAPDADRAIVIMGSGAETARRRPLHLNARRREGRRAQGPALPAVPRRGFRRGAPAVGAQRRRARSHEGAGRGRRAALRRRGHGRSGKPGATFASSAAGTGCRRRSSPPRW